MEEIVSSPVEEPKKSSTPMIAMVIVLLVALGGVGFLLTRPSPVAPTQESQPEVLINTPVVESAIDEAASGVIEVEGGAFYFKPNEIRVKAGDSVTIRLNSVDMQHDFVIDELDVKSEIAKGGTSTEVTFTPTEAGEYEFYCGVGQHRANGMVGTLIVEE